MRECAWKTGSTNTKTGKGELPDRCKELKCDGKEKRCDFYQPMVESDIRQVISTQSNTRCAIP